MNGRCLFNVRAQKLAWIWVPGFLLMSQAPVLAQNAKIPFENGSHAFRFVLHSFELQALHDEKELETTGPENCILVVFGETQRLDNIPGGLDEFLRKGGAVLVATDRGPQEKLQKLFQIEFRNQFISAPRDLAYRGEFEACPMVKPGPVGDIPLFRNLSSVATNKPAYFLNESNILETLATFPGECKVDVRGVPTKLQQVLRGKSAVFAAAGPFGNGRVIILSDHSVFINEMMIQTDNDNFDFAYQCVRWLMDRGENQGQRTHVLFIDEGDAVTNLEIPVTLTDIPTPPIEVLNQMLVKLEQENFFNRLILGENAGQRMGDIIRVLTIVLTTAITGLGCYCFLQARHRPESGEPLFANKVAQQSPDVAIVTQRHLAMVQTDNFWEAAHHLAREWFESVVPGLLAKVAETAGPRSGVLSFTVDAGWWRRWAWENKVKGVWRLAVGSPRKLPAAEFARFVTQLDEIKAAQTRGLLHFHNVT
jgi:hypothetical protein